MDLKSLAEAYQSVQEKKLDPVGKEDGDVDNDGDKDSSDSYLMKRRKAIAKAMKKEEVEKEETEVVEHHQKDANGKVIEHEDEAPGTPSSVEEENDNYVEAYLDELKKTTMGSYISKASSQLMKTSKDAGETSPLESGGAIKNYYMKKALKRRDGIKTAAKKMAKEETVLEQLAENGREIDAFEAVIAYLIDEGFAKSWEEAQDIMVTLKPELVEEVYQNQLIESEKLASKAYERAKTLGARRRSSYEYRKKGSFGPGKNERAGYNLSQSQQSRNASPATQSGPQTGGGPKSFGFARNKSNPVKSKSVGDTGGMGHQKKADTKITTKKDGKTPLKTPRYKYSTKQRDQMGFYGRMEKRDPKKNPKHEANKKK